MINKFIKILALILVLILAWELPGAAQMIPTLDWSESDLTSVSHLPVFTRGNIEEAPVFLDGKIVGTVPAFVQLNPDQEETETVTHKAAIRAQVIHNRLQKLLDNMSIYSQEILPNRGIEGIDEQAAEMRKQLSIYVAKSNNTTVVAAKFPENSSPEVIFSVSQADIYRNRLNSSEPEEIAARIAEIANYVLIEAWKERQTPHLIAQTRRALIFLVILTTFSLGLTRLQKYVALRDKRISQKLSDVNKTLTFSEDIETDSQQDHNSLSLRQSRSLNRLYREGLYWFQWLIWVLGIGYLTSLFYWTRPLSNWIIGISIRGIWADTTVPGWPPVDWLFTFGREAELGAPLWILLILIVIRLLTKMGDFYSDYFAKNWCKKQATRQRQSTRAITLAKSMKNWLRAILYLILGITLAYQLHRLGSITQAVAVLFGFLSFAVSLASQSLLKDLIAGFLIIWEDQYGVGDVVFIGDQSGLVENITLRITQLRNLDGELITIPNGSVEIVRNLSSDWSRVNYAIEIGYDADLDRVMEVMEMVARKLSDDPQWQDRIIDEPEILGVENLAHTGIMVRILIKTKPLEQWPVAREFRRRLKKAFDQEGIDLGIPKQMMYVTEEIPKVNKKSFN